jgi:hypothetical protein
MTPGRLATFAAPGQIESLSFLILPPAGEELKDVRVRASDLTGPAGTIPAAALDLFVVKNWYPLRPKGTPAPIHTTPELLLHNDRLITADREQEQNRLHFDGIPAESPTIQPFDVPKDTVKQVWVNVHVPSDARPGAYQGTIVVESPEMVSLPIMVEVLDIVLLRPAKDNVLYVPACPEDGTYRRMMHDIRAHGVTAVTVYGGKVDWQKGDFSHLRHVLGIVRDAGLMDRLCLIPVEGLTFPPEDLEVARTRAKRLVEDISAYAPGVEFYLMTRDEPSLVNFRKEERALRVCQESGLRTFTAAPPSYLSGGDAITMPNVANKTWAPFPQLASEIAQVHAMNRRIMHYGFTPSRRQPELWRYRVGFWLFGSRFDGSAFWTYLVSGPDAEAWQPEQRWGGGGHFAYPATNTMIPTIQWEAYRAGADDGRYITTLAAQVMLAEKGGLTAPCLADATRILEESASLFDAQKLAEVHWTSERADPIDVARIQEFRRRIADLVLAVQNRFPALHSRTLAQDPQLPEAVRKWRIGLEPKLRGTPPLAAKEFPALHEAMKAALAAAGKAAEVARQDNKENHVEPSTEDTTVSGDRSAAKRAAAGKAAEALAQYIENLAQQGVLNDAEHGYLLQLCGDDITTARNVAKQQ